VDQKKRDRVCKSPLVYQKKGKAPKYTPRSGVGRAWAVTGRGYGPAFRLSLFNSGVNGQEKYMGFIMKRLDSGLNAAAVQGELLLKIKGR
jgi:hypothetical protein